MACLKPQSLPTPVLNKGCRLHKETLISVSPGQSYPEWGEEQSFALTAPGLPQRPVTQLLVAARSGPHL